MKTAGSTQAYFNRFFEEKDLDPEYVLSVPGLMGMNQIPAGCIIDLIKQTRGAEAQKIANTLREIDFANGDIYPYLRHLAQAVAV